MTTTAPYGTWESPISAADTVAGLVAFVEIAVDGLDLYWLEMRPSEGGRQVLVHRGAAGTIRDVTPPPAHPRTLVHEYGGGALTAGHGEVVYSEFSDQRLYRIIADGAVAVTPEPPRPRSVRYADGRVIPGSRMVCVRETHQESGDVANELVEVDLNSGAIRTLASGRDFYSNPRPNHDGTELVWLEWDHPNMPWDGTELKRARLTEDGLADVTSLAGGRDESVYQPEWGPSGELVYVSDRTGWWNLYRSHPDGDEPLLPRAADFGEPAWIFGRSSYGFLSGGRILAGFWEGGLHQLGILEPTGEFTVLEDDLTSHARLTTDGDGTAWYVAAGAAKPTALERRNVDTGGREVLRGNELTVDPGYVSAARIIAYATGLDETAYAVYYPPTNPGFVAPEGERPPAIVEVHGGPTSHVFPRLSSAVLFWTSRGFGVVDVNYRGSTAFGRDYRNRLRGNWGLVDVEDCIAAARFLAGEGEVDEDRLVITGGSAGGYTTLAALAFGDAFSAGASYFGVADVALLAAHTHKFESRYLDGLVGTDPEVMRQRSPLYSADRISAPVVLFQGLDDKVVPPEQAERIAEALAANGVAHAHITYEGEDHGFRRAETIVHSLESELAFYGRVLGFVPAGDLPELELR